MKFLKASIPYLRPHKWLLIIILLCAGLETAYNSLWPLSFTYLIDKAFIPKDSGVFFHTLILLISGGIIGLLAGFGSDYAMAGLSGRVALQLRRRVFGKLHRIPIEKIEHYGIGTIVSRFSNDIPSIGGITAYLIPALFKGLLSALIGTILLFQMQWKLTLLLLLCSVILFAGPMLLEKRSKRASERFKQAQETFIDLVDENVKGHKLVKGFHLADLMNQRAEPRIQSIFQIGTRMNLLFSFLERIPAASLLTLSALMVGVGGYLIFKGDLTVGEFVAMNTVFLQVGQSLLSLSMLWPRLFEAEVSLARIKELLDSSGPDEGSKNRLPLPAAIQEIRFQDVHFRYTEDKDTLKGITLSIPAGGYTVFVGTSGSGKSTALQLLLRFLKPSRGTIYFGDLDLHNHVSECSLYEQLGVVFQDSQFLQMSIKENLFLGRPVSLDTIVEAARLARIHDTIKAMPLQYDTQLDQSGGNLSGGQKQRLAIARALAKNPNYLLFDEASSALDPATEAEINETIEGLRGRKTIISVTHRLASAKRADRIFVFQEGAIVEAGTHEELLRQEGAYKRLWDKQHGIHITGNGFLAQVEASRLAQFPFFEAIAPDLLTIISKQFVSEKYEAGQVIVREGEEGDKFYLIARGAVEVVKGTGANSKAVAVLQDGDHFGEIALLRGIPRTATVTAKMPSVLLSLQREQLLELTYNHHQIYEMLVMTLQERMSS
ncbi:ABC transporter transmembrane domain-containing protein [Paenibacillus periandrae]|uniref:ABC transporter transmembrane domain-containing protein n=1 Tax=Paenibacillus periandrae TaxID=1761741 RepID=UPI001F08B5FB